MRGLLTVIAVVAIVTISSAGEPDRPGKPSRKSVGEKGGVLRGDRLRPSLETTRTKELFLEAFGKERGSEWAAKVTAIKQFQVETKKPNLVQIQTDVRQLEKALSERTISAADSEKALNKAWAGFVRTARPVKANVVIEPPEAQDAVVQWTPAALQSWSQWSQDNPYVTYGRTKFRANKPGWQESVVETDTMRSEIPIRIAMKKASVVPVVEPGRSSGESPRRRESREPTEPEK